MNTNMHGKKILYFLLPSVGGEDSQVVQNCQEKGTLEFSATHHGDHDEFWILRMRDGKEQGRWNTKFVETIAWANEPTPKEPDA